MNKEDTVIKNAPREIYLNFGDLDSGESYDYKNLDGVTFCEDKIDRCDIKYIREDETKYIGITDINDKKIYADSHIVEFNCVADDIVLTGYFTYNIEHQIMTIKLLTLNGDDITEKDKDNFSDWWGLFFEDGNLVYYSQNKVGFDFKIIDTIQENKRGLIK